jgi:hypothetical protein
MLHFSKCNIVFGEGRIIIKPFVPQEAQSFGISVVGCVILMYIGQCTVQCDCVVWQRYETCNCLDSNCCCNYKCTEHVVQ